MRTAIALALAAALAASSASAVDNCFDCVIGIFDDPALTSNRGTIEVGVLKDVYVGVKLTSDETTLAGIELSIAGLNKGGLQVVGTEPLGPRALVFGNSIASPVDTTATSDQVGGISYAASMPRQSGEALLKVTLYATDTIADHVLVVKRSYPTTNSTWHTPVFVRADAPAYTVVRASGSCFVLNPQAGLLGDCQALQRTNVAMSTWSGVKHLFQ
jgi:hypothetical protein